MKLHISINARRSEEAYGGGSQIADILEAGLKARGHQVVRDLRSGLDVILLLYYRQASDNAAYGIDEVDNYKFHHPNTQIVLRINDCDEKHGFDIKGIAKAVFRAHEMADFAIFISEFIHDLYARRGLNMTKPHGVIRNAADNKVFHPQGRAEWQVGEPLRIVTHHWSNNYLKGFDIYERLGQMLADQPYGGLFQFTFIGRTPLGVKLANTNMLPVLNGSKLADALRRHHVYLTASRLEPAGMHAIEGMMCGLPPLFLGSGALPEYCGPFGVEFNLANFDQRLMEMRERYPELRKRVLDCSYCSEDMVAEYESLFCALVEKQRIDPLLKPNLAKKAERRLRRLLGSARARFRRLITR